MNVEKFIIKEIVRHYQSDDFELNADFNNDLFYDSLEFFTLILECEKEFGVPIPDNEAEDLTTPNKLINYIESRL